MAAMNPYISQSGFADVVGELNSCKSAEGFVEERANFHFTSTVHAIILSSMLREICES